MIDGASTGCGTGPANSHDFDAALIFIVGVCFPGAYAFQFGVPSHDHRPGDGGRTNNRELTVFRGTRTSHPHHGEELPGPLKFSSYRAIGGSLGHIHQALQFRGDFSAADGAIGVGEVPAAGAGDDWELEGKHLLAPSV